MLFVLREPPRLNRCNTLAGAIGFFSFLLMIRGQHLLPFRLFSQTHSCPPALFLEQLLQAKPLQMERIIWPQSQPECSLRPQLRATFLLHPPGGSRASVKRKNVFWKKDYFTVYWSILAPHPPTHSLFSSSDWPPALWTCSWDFLASD